MVTFWSEYCVHFRRQVMGAGQMSGSPWHVEVLKMDEYDDRRHRSRCIHYSKESKYCDQYIGDCRGSAHCPYYEEGYISAPRSTSTKTSHKKKSTHITFPKRVHAGKMPSKEKKTNPTPNNNPRKKNKPINMSFNQALKKINN